MLRTCPGTDHRHTSVAGVQGAARRRAGRGSQAAAAAGGRSLGGVYQGTCPAFTQSLTQNRGHKTWTPNTEGTLTQTLLITYGSADRVPHSRAPVLWRYGLSSCVACSSSPLLCPCLGGIVEPHPARADFVKASQNPREFWHGLEVSLLPLLPAGSGHPEVAELRPQHRPVLRRLPAPRRRPAPGLRVHGRCGKQMPSFRVIGG